MEPKPKNSTTGRIESLNDDQDLDQDVTEYVTYEPEFRKRLKLMEVKVVDMGEDLRRCYRWKQ